MPIFSQLARPASVWARLTRTPTPTPPPSPDIYPPDQVRAGWGPRPDGTPKGDGYFGALRRPDGGVMSEYSVSFDDALNGQDVPSLVPTLTDAEVHAILNAKEGEQLPTSVYQKAAAFARQRAAHGLDPFAQPGEQNYLRLPDVSRVRTW